MPHKIHLSTSEISLKFPFKISTKNTNSILNFEEKLERYYGTDKKIVALNSGTSAIHLALILSGVKKGDEVLCQSFTYVATVNPIQYQNATPIFVDSELDTWNMCPVYLEKAIKDRISKGKKPKAIIFVHIYGMPAKVDEIVSVAKKYNIALIEDAAEALGSEYKGKKCGSFGDFGILSFNNNKIISTFGGGALICNTKIDKQQAIFLATQAKDKSTHYEHSKLGYNYRLSPLLAELGCYQLDTLDQNIAFRRKNNQFYQNLFKHRNQVLLFKEPSKSYFSNHWLNCILFSECNNDFFKEELKVQLDKDKIEYRTLWKPMHLQPLFKKHPFYGARKSEYLFKNGLCLPSGSNLKKNDFIRIKDSINKIL
ncbi:aminotransferase class I/II-fold pyridoxal phosphate-dependent enzyme [uncultured Polaribacter sp.]|uniref:aminotransferase class I/II-fold pyridoxal phosphate-dependent enzyme n=1 Tax=uncultured Polaribacter sp. TaxID=174711 RepID=UPI00262BEDE8|nr:aminotransferase class I/II-fold pyridoxal phosphate-dependent enzyme [uncultured Polaribacter sp.]